MHIGVVGSGYVGLVQGVVMAQFGFKTICMDVDRAKIERLKSGEVPIYEPGLKDFLSSNIKRGRIEFTSDLKYTIGACDVIFIAVGTPPQEDGSADLKYVISVAQDIGEYISGYKVIVNKSTVPVGTGRLVKDVISSKLRQKGKTPEFDVVSNPEFLREGKAIEDAMNPERVVIGTQSQRALETMKRVYKPFSDRGIPFVLTNLETAELIKYACNSFLAVKISYINELALLSEKVGADILTVAQAMGMDERIGKSYLSPGPGYGGSCLPKDTRAIVRIGEEVGEDLLVIGAAVAANEKQKARMVKKVADGLGSLDGKTVAVLGLTFKPDTDDIREAPSIDIINGLTAGGASIRAYCPKGMTGAGLKGSVHYCECEYDAVAGADALVILTEWKQFEQMDLSRVKTLMKGRLFFDLRNMFAHNDKVRALFDYRPLGTD